MNASKTSNAYGFKEVAKSSNNIKSLHQQRQEETRKENSNDNVAEQTVDEIIALVEAYYANPTNSLDDTEVQDFSKDKKKQLMYLRLLEAYLSNQLLQVKEKIEALKQEDLE